jgi:nicotinamidase-related amidase
MITALDKNIALVLIDLQNSVVSMPLAHPIKNVLQNVNTLIDVFRKRNLPIVAVNVNPSGASWTKTRKEAKPMALPDNDDWYKISNEVNVQANDIYITKHTWNAFFETPLNDELKKHSVTGVVLAGVSTSIGVEGTARAASELGYNITFATDAMTDREEEAHQRSIKYIFPRMGETGTTKEIVEMLEKAE